MMEMVSSEDARWDLHCHSTFSDGSLTPTELVERALKVGLGALALTDHDTIKGLPEFCRSAKGKLHAVTGIEVSTQWCGACIHVVALNFDSENPLIQMLVDSAHEIRLERALTISKKLEQRLQVVAERKGRLFTLASEIAQKAVLGRPHFAKALVKEGYCQSEAKAFKKYLGTNKVGDVKALWPSLESAVIALRQANAVPVLAHPGCYPFTKAKLKRLVQEFKSAGGQGVELSVPSHSTEFMLWLEALLEKNDLSASMGSDFHFPCKWSELGCTKPFKSHKVPPVWEYFR